MNPFAKALLSGLAVGAVAALTGFLVGKLFVRGADPERIAHSLMLIFAFLAGTIACGITAARINPAKAFSTAALAALCFEVILLVVARPGLSPRIMTIAIVVAMFFALISAFIGLPRKRN